jgi:hypothetical protein
MYENTHDVLLKQKLIKLIEENVNFKDVVLTILIEEFDKPKIPESGTLIFCECGYPIKLKTFEKTIWLEALLKTEVDFDHFKEHYYCTKCNKFLIEIQY